MTGAIPIAVLCLALTACTPVEPSPFAVIAPAPPPGEPVVTLLADMSGTIELTESGCFGLRLEGQSQVTAAIFPYGSMVSRDGSSITVPGLGELEPGSRIEAGGGFVKRNDDREVSGACEAEEYALIQPPPTD